jgi:hypothetical protein
LDHQAHDILVVEFCDKNSVDLYDCVNSNLNWELEDFLEDINVEDRISTGAVYCVRSEKEYVGTDGAKFSILESENFLFTAVIYSRDLI